MSGEAESSQAALVKHKCPDCGYLARTPSKLTDHRRMHSGKRPFACDLCDSTFATKAHRDRHIRQVHLKSETVTCSWSGCDKTFASMRSMQLHVAAIHQQTLFHCPVTGCKFASGWKDAINIHVRAIHAKEKPFACSVAGCHYRSAYQTHLSSHRRSMHEGSRVTCPHDGCSYSASLPQNLKTHVECVHKKQLRYACHVCGNSVYFKSTLRRHQQVHAKQGHPVADCASCQEDLEKDIMRSPLVTQEEPPSVSSDGVSHLLTTLHLDMRLLSFSDD